MTPKQNELRFVTTHSNPHFAAQGLGNFFNNHQIRHLGYYIPGHDRTIIAYNFTNANQINKFANLANLDYQLDKLKIKQANERFLHNADHRTVFVNGMKPEQFECFTTADGADEDETLPMKLTQYIEALKETDLGK